jgi:hypothetical protein
VHNEDRNQSCNVGSSTTSILSIASVMMYFLLKKYIFNDVFSFTFSIYARYIYFVELSNNTFSLVINNIF